MAIQLILIASLVRGVVHHARVLLSAGLVRIRLSSSRVQNVFVQIINSCFSIRNSVSLPAPQDSMLIRQRKTVKLVQQLAIHAQATQLHAPVVRSAKYSTR